MTAEVLPFAKFSTAVDVATDTQADVTIIPSEEAFAVVQISEDAGVTYTNATTPKKYTAETVETLEDLEEDTLVRVNFFGGVGTCSVEIEASTP